MLTVTNHGPLITSTNFWTTELAREGKLFVSVNGGAIRVLLPPTAYGVLSDMRTARECILSRGPWPLMRLPDAIEILFDDGSASPFALHLSPESFDMLPGEPDAGREWIISVWTEKDGRPHKSLERICHWRRSARLPDLSLWRKS